nr:hypothetical protein [uncultured Acetatifactor sp.]
MKKNTLKTMLLASVLGIAIFSTALPMSAPEPIQAPSEPAPADELPGEAKPLVDESDINPLSDLDKQKTELQ